jgi:hypothetical protein
VGGLSKELNSPPHLNITTATIRATAVLIMGPLSAIHTDPDLDLMAREEVKESMIYQQAIRLEIDLNSGTSSFHRPHRLDDASEALAANQQRLTTMQDHSNAVHSMNLDMLDDP